MSVRLAVTTLLPVPLSSAPLISGFGPSRARRPGVDRTSVLSGSVAVLLSIASLTACASDGRELAEPQDWQTTTTRPAPPTSAPDQQLGESGVRLQSPDFAPGGAAPNDVTCTGANQSPALEWDGVPADTVELAVALSDQTNPAEPLLLWLVTGISPDLAGMDAGVLPSGVVQPLNDYGQSGWGNPCLNTLKEGNLDLQFRLYLLSSPSGVESGDPGNEAWDTVQARSIDSASLLMRVTSVGP